MALTRLGLLWNFNNVSESSDSVNVLFDGSGDSSSFNNSNLSETKDKKIHFSNCFGQPLSFSESLSEFKSESKLEDKSKETFVNEKSNVVDIMQKAIDKWQQKGKIKNVVKLNKGEIVKMMPQFKTVLDLFSNYESFVYDPVGSEVSGAKGILVANDSSVRNFLIKLSEVNKWDIDEFTKSFSESVNHKISEDYKEIAKEIFAQLGAGGPFNSARSYFGMNQFVSGIDKPKTPEEIKNLEGTEFAKDKFLKKGNLGFLQFKAKGSKMSKGVKVKIALNAKDLYDITIYKMSTYDFKIVDQIEDVYAEDLFNVLKNTLG